MPTLYLFQLRFELAQETRDIRLVLGNLVFVLKGKTDIVQTV